MVSVITGLGFPQASQIAGNTKFRQQNRAQNVHFDPALEMFSSLCFGC